MTLTARRRLPILLVALAALVLSLIGAPVAAQDAEVPAAPTGLAVANVSHNSVELEWDDPNDDSITHYQVLRRDRDVHALGEFVTIDSDTGSDAASYTDDTVEPEKSYVYRVVAVNRHGASGRSGYSRADTPAAPRGSGPLAGFTVVDASDQTAVGTLTDGATLALDDPDNGSYGVRADLKSGEEIGSVRLELAGAKDVARTENIAPYSLYGDDADGLHGQALPAGEYTLTATAYAEARLGGAVLGTLAVSFTVTGPPAEEEDQNSPATGLVVITGDAYVGETLTADTSGISDADGLGNPDYGYQWIRHDGTNDTDISGAADSTYTLAEDDEGNAIKVRVSFTDDASNPEELTSEATAFVVTLIVIDPAQAPSNLTARGSDGSVALNWDAPTKDADTVTGYRILRGQDDGELAVLVADTESTDTTHTDTDVPGDLTAYRYQVKALRGEEASRGSDVADVLVASLASGNTVGKPVITGTLRVGETLTADISGVSDPDGMSTINFYDWRRGQDSIPGAAASTYTLVEEDLGHTIRVIYSYYDGNFDLEIVNSDFVGPVEAAELPTFVPADWSLIPTGLGVGDQFRLLFISSATRNAVPTDIDTYNTWVQNLAAAGHTGIQIYSSSFRAVGSTEDVDARDNTSTTYTSSDKGVAIYWLNGNKAADQYEDFYDGDWDEEASMRTEAGTTVAAPDYVWTGSRANGTAHNNNPLGAALTAVGIPNSDVANQGPVFGSSSRSPTRFSHSLYGLSGVFEVGAVEVPSDWNLIPSGLVEGDQFRLLFISSAHRTAEATDIATYNTWVQDLAAAGHTDIQDYSATFRAVGSTEDVDARDNTVTTGTGVAIYWLGGNKVADNYADFYDESWDEEASMRNESGTEEAGVSAWTGSDHDGTEFFNADTTSRALGNSNNAWVSFGKTDSTDHGPLSGEALGRGSDKRIYALSGVFQVSEPTSATAPGAPTALEATANGRTEIELSWTAPADDGGSDITGYRIEWSADGTSDWADLVADTGNADAKYSNTGLTPGTTRHYRVSAINAEGTGEPSNAADATTERVPVTVSLPGSLWVVEDTGFINVQLTATTGVDEQPQNSFDVAFRTTSATAEAFNDYITLDLPVTFAPADFAQMDVDGVQRWVAVRSIVVPLIFDTDLEASETFGVEIAPPAGGLDPAITLEPPTEITVTIVDDDALTPSPSDPDVASPSTAQYTITFTGSWTTTATPDGVPTGAHFSPLIGGVHNDAVSFLEAGGTASVGVESMAETGATATLKSEVDADANALSVLERSGNIDPTATVTLDATLTTEYPRVTLLTMIAPSPDWFVGVSGLSLLDDAGAWDAGTEDGAEFSVTNPETSSQGTITNLTGTGKFSYEKIATLTFTLDTVTSTDATLSALTLSDGTLAPAFASDTYAYTASVGNSVSQITVTATTTDSNATFEFLDESDAAIADADGNTEGQQVDLTVGANVINVTVTAEDGSATQTYTVTVTRAAPLSTDATLVSNAGKSDSGSRGVNTLSYAQPFDTGTHAGGYSLSSIVLDWEAAPTGTGTLTVTVRANSSGSPSRVLYTLTNPASFSAGLNEFTAPPNARLAANTTYHVVASYSADSGGPDWWRTLVSNGIDSGGAAGWDINAPYRTRIRGSTDIWASRTSRAVQIQVKGATYSPSTDATLSDLSLSGGTLDPAFAGATVTYTADVATAVSQTTVTAATTDSNATFEFLDESDAAIADADGNTEGQQVDLTVGANVIKVKVTAEDGATTQTYTVRVTRAAPVVEVLVSNVGQKDRDRDFFVVSNSFKGQQFTTGSNAEGYTLSEVVVNIREGSTNATTVAVYTSTDSDVPGTKVVDLTGSVATAGEQSFAPTSETTLSASTDYFVYFAVAASVGPSLQSTSSDAEDAGAATGWSIGDRSVFSTDDGTTWAGSTVAVEIAVKGSAINPPVSTDATLSALTVSDGTLSPAFASDTYAYTASVGNSVSQTTVTPTTTDPNATFEFLDESDASLADADGNTAGQQVDLAVGANVIKVKVTAEDATATQTYMVTVTRNTVPVITTTSPQSVAENTTAVATT